MEIKELNPLEVKKLIENGAVFIDVREPIELEEVSFNIHNVINIPLSIFAETYVEIPKERNIVLACHLGVRSYNAANFLISNGWNPEKVHSLRGGIDAWSSYELPIN